MQKRVALVSQNTLDPLLNVDTDGVWAIAHGIDGVQAYVALLVLGGVDLRTAEDVTVAVLHVRPRAVGLFRERLARHRVAVGGPTTFRVVPAVRPTERREQNQHSR